MSRQVLLAIVFVLVCTRGGLTATSSLQSIIGGWYDATESDVDPRPGGIAQEAARCKAPPGAPGSAVFISESELVGYEQLCKIRKTIPHGPAVEIVMSCITEGTPSQEHRIFQLLDRTHLRVSSKSSDGFVLMRCPSSEMNNARSSDAPNKRSGPTSESSAPHVVNADTANRQNDVPYHFTIGYQDEGKIEANEQACRSYVASGTAWDNAMVEKGVQEVCAARRRHIEAYAKLQGDYWAMIETFSTDQRLKIPEAASNLRRMIKACMDHKFDLTTGGHNIMIDIIQNDVATDCLVLASDLVRAEIKKYNASTAQ